MNTTYFLNQVMGNLFGTKKVPALPADYFIGLSKTEPNAAGGSVTEPTGAGSGYQRVKLETLSAPANGEITNTDAVLFPESLTNWGIMTHFVIYDAQTGGNLLMFDELNQSRTAEINTVVMIKPGGLKLTLKDAVATP